MNFNRNEHSRFVQRLDKIAEKNPILWLPCVVLIHIAIGVENISEWGKSAFSHNEQVSAKDRAAYSKKPFTLRVVAMGLVMAFGFMTVPDLASIISMDVHASSEVIVNHLIYNIDGNKATVVGIDSQKSLDISKGQIVIPPVVTVVDDEYTIVKCAVVNSIADNAFSNLNFLNALVIPNTVTSIGENILPPDAFISAEPNDYSFHFFFDSDSYAYTYFRENNYLQYMAILTDSEDFLPLSIYKADSIRSDSYYRNYLPLTKPYDQLLESYNDSNAFKFGIASWQTLTFEGSHLVDVFTDEHDMYLSFLFEILSTNFADKDMVGADYLDTLSIMSDIAELADEVDLEATMTIEEAEKFQGRFDKITDLDTKFLKPAKSVIKAGNSFFEVYNTINNIYSMSQLDEDMTAFLCVMRKKTNNPSLQWAIDEVLAASENLTITAIEQLSVHGAQFASKKFLGLLGDSLVDSHPGLKALALVRDGVAYAVNEVFSTEDIIKQYYLLKYFCELEDVVQGALEFCETEYAHNKNLNNSKLFQAGVKIYFITTNKGFDCVDKMAEIVYKNSLMGMHTDKYESIHNSLDECKKYNEVAYNQFDLVYSYLSIYYYVIYNNVIVEFADGDGSINNPYQVATAEQLNAIRNDLSANYIQIADIDLSVYDNWIPIGTGGEIFCSVLGVSKPYPFENVPFSGSYNGQNYKISNMTIVTSDFDSVGLFGHSIGDISNIVLENVNINANRKSIDYSEWWNKYTYSYLSVGGIVGALGTPTHGSKEPVISNCTVSGTIEISDGYDSAVGGIAGIGNVINSTNNAEISVICNQNGRNENDSTIFVGGIVGQTNSTGGQISNCTNYGNILAIAGSFAYCGGICGQYGSISYSVNYGDIKATASKCSYYNSYANVCAGGIAGVISSFESHHLINYGSIEAYAFCAEPNEWSTSSSAGGIIGIASNAPINNTYNLGSSIMSSMNSKNSYAGRQYGKIYTTNNNYSENYSVNTTLVNGVIPTESIGHNQTNGESLSRDEIEKRIEEFTINYPSDSDLIFGDFAYRILNDKVTITKYKGHDTNVIIPDIIEGLPVTDLSYNAFNDCTNLTEITIPDSIQSIGDNAFSKYASLTIYCNPGSCAERYAKLNNIRFSYLGDVPTSDILEIIRSAIENSTLKIDTLKYGTELTVNEITEAKAKNLTLEIVANGFMWTVRAVALPNIGVDFDVISPSGLVNLSEINSDFDDHRDFSVITPSGAELSFNCGSSYYGNYANIFKISNGTFSYVDSVLVEQNGDIKLTPENNSSYFIAIDNQIINNLTNKHTHSFGTSWNSDNSYHWHECTCGERSDISQHTEDSGVVTIAPTETTEGEMTYSCTVCGYVTRRESIPANHTHIPSAEYSSDETGHWYSCTLCGGKIDFAPHSEDSGTVILEPTENATGLRVYRCTVCGYERTETIPIISEDHTHTFGTSWTYDSTYHWHECSCGERTDTDRHTDNGGIVTVQPTSSTTGTKVHSCMVCGCVIYTETISALGIIDRPDNPDLPPDVLPMPIFPSDRNNILSKEIELSVRSELTGLSSEGAHIESIRKFFPESATIRLTETADSQRAAELAMNNFDNEKMICYPFDISVYSTATGEKIQLRHSGYITFEIPVPESMVNISDSIAVYHIAGGTPEHIESEIITDTKGNKKIKFTAKKFSPYMFTAETAEDITAEAAANSTSSDFTGPVSNGVTVPAMKLPRIVRWTGRKKRFRIIKKRRINDILFAF